MRGKRVRQDRLRPRSQIGPVQREHALRRAQAAQLHRPVRKTRQLARIRAQRAVKEQRSPAPQQLPHALRIALPLFHVSSAYPRMPRAMSAACLASLA